MHTSENLIKHRFCAKYIVCPDGIERLYSVQEFARPVFCDDGWERDIPREASKKKSDKADSVKNAVRRAKRLAFDLAIANNFDAFFTLTYAPSETLDRTRYSDVYKPLRVWLSNQVQRKGLRYIMTAERHKKGGIHFHGLCNASALSLVAAVNPYSGAEIFHNGKQVFNISNWEKMGFSTCKMLDSSTSDRVSVAKYVTKYITKDADKVGGRYIYHGGDLVLPRRALADSMEEITTAEPLRSFACNIPDVGDYAEHIFL